MLLFSQVQVGALASGASDRKIVEVRVFFWAPLFIWLVQIRKSGTAPLTKTFTHKKDAQQWANEIERKIDQGLILELSHPDYETLSQILERYKNEITISKRGGYIEAYRLAKIMRDPVAEIKLSQLSAMHIADYRDRRLK